METVCSSVVEQQRGKPCFAELSFFDYMGHHSALIIAEENVELQEEFKCLSEEVARLQELSSETESPGQWTEDTHNIELGVGSSHKSPVQANLTSSSLGMSISKQPAIEFQEELRRLSEAKEQLQTNVGMLAGHRADGLSYNGDLFDRVEGQVMNPDLSELISLAEQQEREWRASDAAGFSPYSTISPLVALYAKGQTLQQSPLLPTPPSITASLLQDAMNRHGLLAAPAADVADLQQDRPNGQLENGATQSASGDRSGWGSAKRLTFGAERKANNGSPESPSSLSDFSPRTLLRTPDLRFSFLQDSRLSAGLSPKGISAAKLRGEWEQGRETEIKAFSEDGPRGEPGALPQLRSAANGDAAVSHDMTIHYFTDLLDKEQRMLLASMQRERTAVEQLAMLQAEHTGILDELKRMKEDRLARSQDGACAEEANGVDAPGETLSDLGICPEDISEMELRAAFVEEMRQRREAEASVVELSSQLAAMSAMVQELSEQLEHSERVPEERQSGGSEDGERQQTGLSKSETETGVQPAQADIHDVEPVSTSQDDLSQVGGRRASHSAESNKTPDLQKEGVVSSLGNLQSSADEKARQIAGQLAVSEEARSAAEEQVDQLERKVQRLERELREQGQQTTTVTKGQGLWRLLQLPLLVAVLVWLSEMFITVEPYGGLPPT